MTDVPQAGPSLADFLDRRVVLVAGKGGVGRTTMTAAIARAAARAGKRVLVSEIGVPSGDYSPLARLYGRDSFPTRPVPIDEDIEGCLLWARDGHALFFERVMPRALVRAGIRSKSLARLLNAAPSLNELGVFYRLLKAVTETTSSGRPRWDLVLVDMPATGHSLALTGLPAILQDLMPTGPVAEAMVEGTAVFHDPELSGACVVTLPETLPVTEALELIDGLRETKIPVGWVVVNKVVEDRFDDAERELLTPLLADQPVFGASRFTTMAQIEECLAKLGDASGVPRMLVPEFPQVGDALISAVAETLLPEAP
jgi:arsenite/tail-anchored protein-transporting ATPase